MGVLEDAIREHIELRRQHGAPEDELRDQEAEALGPARREEEVAEEPAPAASVEPEDQPTRLAEVPPPEPEVEDEAGAPFDVAATGDPEFERSDEPRPDPVLEDEPFVIDEPIALEPERPEPELLDADPPEPEVVEAELMEEEPVTEVGSPFEEPFSEEPPPTEIHDVEQELAEEEAPPTGEPAENDEDVLEETPDFLQETPEHDRLWFEQKPPRDFDFD